MHDQTIAGLSFDHGVPPAAGSAERRTWMVVGLTAWMMVAEIGVGLWSGSKALEADGWHMATHAGAIGLAGLAYWYARTRAGSARFSFGTGKVYALSAWTNAVLLLIAGLWMGIASGWRFLHPVSIAVGEALPVAVLGLVVNIVSAYLLRPQPEAAPAAAPAKPVHDHGHDHGHGHAHEHAPVAPPPVVRAAPAPSVGHGHSHDHDLNRESAFLHVMLDLLTSVTAIVALVAVQQLGWWWLDPLMGLLGGVLVLRWGVNLLGDAGRQLLDAAPNDEVVKRVRDRLEQIDDVRVADLHLWELGLGRKAVMATIVTHTPRAANVYREAIRRETEADHLTVEVLHCGATCGDVHG